MDSAMSIRFSNDNSHGFDMDYTSQEASPSIISSSDIPNSPSAQAGDDTGYSCGDQTLNFSSYASATSNTIAGEKYVEKGMENFAPFHAGNANDSEGFSGTDESGDADDDADDPEQTEDNNLFLQFTTIFPRLSANSTQGTTASETNIESSQLNCQPSKILAQNNFRKDNGPSSTAHVMEMGNGSDSPAQALRKASSNDKRHWQQLQNHRHQHSLSQPSQLLSSTASDNSELVHRRSLSLDQLPQFNGTEFSDTPNTVSSAASGSLPPSRMATTNNNSQGSLNSNHQQTFPGESAAVSSSQSVMTSSSREEHPKLGNLLNIYIYDYLKKCNFNEAAEKFSEESSLNSDSKDYSKVPIDMPRGFLLEWWTVFWDFYNARTSKPSSQEAVTFINTLRQMTHIQNAQKLSQINRSATQQFATNGIRSAGTPVSTPLNNVAQTSQENLNPSTITLQQQYQLQQQKLLQTQQKQNALRLLQQQQQQQHLALNQSQQQNLVSTPASSHASPSGTFQSNSPQNQQRPALTQAQLALLVSQYLAQFGVSNQQFNALVPQQKQAIIRRVLSLSNVAGGVSQPSPQPTAVMWQAQNSPANTNSSSVTMPQVQFQQPFAKQQIKRARTDEKVPYMNHIAPQQIKSVDQMQNFQRMAVQKQQLQAKYANQQLLNDNSHLMAQLMAQQAPTHMPTNSGFMQSNSQQPSINQQDHNMLMNNNSSETHSTTSSSTSKPPPSQPSMLSNVSINSNNQTESFRELLNTATSGGTISSSADVDFDLAYLNSLDPTQPIDFQNGLVQMQVPISSTPSTAPSFVPSKPAIASHASGERVKKKIVDAREWNDAEVESWLNLDV